MADTLNAEGWHPARRCETFNAQMVNRLLTPQGAGRSTHPPSPLLEKLDANEWTLPALAKRLGRSRLALYGWVRRGFVQARKAKTDHPHGVWIIRADEAERAAGAAPGSALAAEAARVAPRVQPRRS